MTEFAPEDFLGIEGREDIEQLSEAFLVAGDPEVLDDDIDDDPIEPMDI